MKYFGTAFSLSLVGLRLRIRIDLEDVPDEGSVAHHVTLPVRRSETAPR